MTERDHKRRALAKLEAFDHPLRVAILTSLSLRPASSKELAIGLKAPPGKVRYQLDRLRRAGLVELKERRQRRGVSEQVYFARPAPFSESEISYLSGSQRDRAIAGILKAVLNDALKALRAGAFGKADDFMVTRLPLPLDPRGWAEVAEIHRRAQDHLLRAREEARERIDRGAHPIIDVFSVQLLFESPRSTPPDV